MSSLICSNCGTTKTPLWRRSPSGASICNACGLYLKAKKSTRPAHYTPSGSVEQAVPAAAEGTCPGGGICNGTGGGQGCDGCPSFNNRLVLGRSHHRRDTPADRSSSPETNGNLSCQNCGTVNTPLWRKDDDGNTICNACGLYFKLHGEARPVAMKKSTIKRRKRSVAPSLQNQRSSSGGSATTANDQKNSLVVLSDVATSEDRSGNGDHYPAYHDTLSDSFHNRQWKEPTSKTAHQGPDSRPPKRPRSEYKLPPVQSFPNAVPLPRRRLPTLENLTHSAHTMPHDVGSDTANGMRDGKPVDQAVKRRESLERQRRALMAQINQIDSALDEQRPYGPYEQRQNPSKADDLKTLG